MSSPEWLIRASYPQHLESGIPCLIFLNNLSFLIGSTKSNHSKIMPFTPFCHKSITSKFEDSQGICAFLRHISMKSLLMMKSLHPIFPLLGDYIDIQKLPHFNC